MGMPEHPGLRVIHLFTLPLVSQVAWRSRELYATLDLGGGVE